MTLKPLPERGTSEWGFNGSLFEFQQEDVEKLSDVENVLCAHEMGLGKTWIALYLDIERRDDPLHDETLVVAPLSVLSSWKDHIQKLVPWAQVRQIDPKKRGELFAEKANFYLIHWEALRLMPELKSMRFHNIIADECHRAKNRKAKQTAALKDVRSRYKMGLSGTPVTNYPNDLWSILNWLYPESYRSYWNFYKQFVDFEIIYPQGFHKIIGPKNERELQKRIEPFFVRRLKKDVLPDLPDKYYTQIFVDLDPAQRRIYNEMKKDMLAWIGEHEDKPVAAPIVISQLVRLQQFTSAYADIVGGDVKLREPSSKLDALMQIIDDNPGKKLVVFSSFKQVIKLAKQRLREAKITHVEITGDVPHKFRGPDIRKFQDGDAQIFLGTITAGGIGITLTAADTVVFLDRDWSPANNQQAEDRLHRIGQANAVQVIDIIARNTVDLGRHQKLEKKWTWIKQLLGDE